MHDSTPQKSGVTRRRALRAIGASSAVGMAGFGGCLGGGDGDDDPDGTGTDSNGTGSDLSGTEITFLTDYSSDPYQEFYDEVNQAFEEETGATVKMEFTGIGAGGTSRIAQLLQAGNPPELFHVNAIDGSQFVQQGAAAPLNGVIETIYDRYGDPGERYRLEIEGDDYMVPLLANIGTNWFRTDVYDSVPSSWDDMLEQAAAADSDGLRSAFVSAGPSGCTNLQFLGFLYANGGQICERNDEGEVEVIMDQGSNRDAWVETLEFLQELHNYSPTNSDTDCGEMFQAIATSTSAQAWYIGARPKGQAVAQETPFAEDVKPSPTLTPDGSGGTTVAISEGFVAFEGANTEAAAAYAEFFTREEHLVKSYFPDPVHNIPPYEAILENDLYQETYEEIFADTAWTAEDNEQYFENAQDFQTMAGETDPPNPYAGVLYGTNDISNLQTEAFVNDRDAGEVVDDYAERMRSTLEEAQG